MIFVNPSLFPWRGWQQNLWMKIMSIRLVKASRVPGHGPLSLGGSKEGGTAGLDSTSQSILRKLNLKTKGKGWQLLKERKASWMPVFVEESKAGGLDGWIHGGGLKGWRGLNSLSEDSDRGYLAEGHIAKPGAEPRSDTFHSFSIKSLQMISPTTPL